MSSRTTEVMLNKGFVAIIDSEDLELVSCYNWNVTKQRHKHYAHTVTEGRRILVMHRFLLRPDRGVLVDHINGDGLDNRRANLRLANYSQNAANRGKPQCGRSTSRYKGVFFESSGTRKNRWRALIRVNGQRIHLGAYSEELEAAVAYDTAAKKHFGEFAKLNLP